MFFKIRIFVPVFIILAILSGIFSTIPVQAAKKPTRTPTATFSPTHTATSTPTNTPLPPTPINTPPIFEPYVNFPVGAGNTVGIGDFNSDGLSDVALTTTTQLMVFLQNQNGTLADAIAYAAGSRPEAMAVGDVNNDDRDDIVVANYDSSTISVFLQQVDGIFGSRLIFSSGSGPDAVAIGDINSDGLADIAVSHWTAPNIGVFLQSDGGALNPMITYPSPQAGYDDISIADINHDGKNDVIKMNGQGFNPNLSVYIQNENGTLSSALSYSVTDCGSFCLSHGLSTGDVTGDGLIDIVVSYGGNRPNSKIAVFAQAQDGSLEPPVAYNAYDIPVPVEVSDVNQDSRADVFVAHSGWNALSIFSQQGDGTLGTYSLHTLPYSSYRSQGLAVGDLNQDGLIDAAIADNNNGLVILYQTLVPLNTPTPTFTPTYTPISIVTNTNDSGPGSLRQIIADAASGDTITFDPSLSGQTVTLASDLIISKNLTIDGSELSSQITISGGDVSHIRVNSTVTISDLTITNGYGSGLVSYGNLAILNSTLKNNYSANNGGAIYSAGNLTIKNSTFTQNQAGGYGGAIAVAGNGTAEIINSTITKNRGGRGGGISISGSPNVNVYNSTFAENFANQGAEITSISSTSSLFFANTIFACAPENNVCYEFFLPPATTNSIFGVGALQDFGLAGLADNGGPTQTMALLSGSSLIDAGEDATCANAPVNSLDQRGVSRPQGEHCDIGAYESGYDQEVHYVKWDAGGANNGISWADAFTDLQSALSVASPGEEIWVAAGTYKPTTDHDRSKSFTLKNGVAIYGGFAGTETLRDQRNLAVNMTILSGDIGVVNDNSDNSYHVVVGSNTNNSAVLDSFLITGGNANASPDDKGGGIYNHRGSPTIMAVSIERNSAIFGGGMYNGDTEFGSPGQGSHPILVNVNFISNSAVEGGGMENQFSSSPSVTNSFFYGNTAVRSGGGMLNMYNSSPTITRVEFVENLAAGGGGMANDQSSPSLTDVTFRHNSVSFYGGGMSNTNYSNPALRNVTFSGNTAVDVLDTYGGGMFNSQSSPSLINVTFHNNSATYGGGMIIRDASSNPTLLHVTLSGNRAFVMAGGITNDGTLVIRNSILWGNLGGEIVSITHPPDVAYSIVQGGNPGTGNLDADPLLGPLQDNGGFTQTMALGAGSPAIDAGDDANCPANDQHGVTRPQGSRCDIGAYEYEYPATPTPTFTSTPAVFSVILQPDAAAGLDTYIYSGSRNSNFGMAAEMGIGEDSNAKNRVARSLIRFDLASIPVNATINSAVLSLWTSSDLSSSDRTIRVFRLKVPFDETEATWNSSAAGVSWQSAGASGSNDRESSAMGSVIILNNEPINVEKQILLSPAGIQEMVEDSFANHGFIIVADTEENDRFNYKTSDSTTSSQRPKLVIQYTVPSATPTITSTATPTPLPTHTSTQIPSQTATFTSTVTATYTPTVTETAIRTPSPTFTLTGTATYTPIPANTATYTPSATRTPSPTATNSPQASNTPTQTSSPPFTPTATGTTTFTPTVLPSFTFTPTFSPTSTQTLAPSVQRVAYWKLEENSSPWTDSTGRGHTLTRVAGSTISVIGKVGNGLNNASNATDLQTGSHPDFDFTRTEGFTIEAWARTSNNESNWKMLFGRRSTTGTVIRAGHWQGEMAFGVRTSTGQGKEIWYSPVQPVNDGQWHHWVFTLDPTHMGIWMDGQLVLSTPHNLTSGDFSASAPFYIMREGKEPNRWLGDVDEFAVYRGVLSQAEILDHYNNGLGRYYDG